MVKKREGRLPSFFGLVNFQINLSIFMNRFPGTIMQRHIRHND